MSAAIPGHVTEKVRAGHTLESDPPSGMSAASRWTCKTCSECVLDYCGNVYGGATERTCEESIAFWAPAQDGPEPSGISRIEADAIELAGVPEEFLGRVLDAESEDQS